MKLASEPNFGTVLVIEVDGNEIRPTGVNSDKYRVETLEGEPTVLVYQTNRFPLYLQFQHTHSSIAAIGFASHGNKIHPHKKAGGCGGCFSLEADFPEEATRTTPLIINTGENPRLGYDFKIFLSNGEVIDPRIYNNGNPQGGFWEKLLRFFLRLWWWITSWFR